MVLTVEWKTNVSSAVLPGPRAYKMGGTEGHTREAVVRIKYEEAGAAG